MTDFLAASPLWQIAHSRAVRDRTAPIVGARHPVGHMPDPRTPPAWMHRQAAVPDTQEPGLPRGWMWSALAVMAIAALAVAGLVML